MTPPLAHTHPDPRVRALLMRERADALAGQARAMLREAVRLNVAAADLEDEAADLEEARRAAGSRTVRLAHPPRAAAR